MLFCHVLSRSEGMTAALLLSSCATAWQPRYCVLSLSSRTIKLMVQCIYFPQNWLEDKTLMNNTSGKALWNHWCELCSRRFPITCSCFHRSQHGREQQQTVPLPPLYCYCWSWFQNAQSPTARNTINYPEGRWWKRTGTDHHISVLLMDIG